MSKTMKRVSALLLAILMIVSFMPMLQENTYAAAKVGKPSITAKVTNQNIAFSWKAKNAKKYTVTITNTVTKKVVKKFTKKATKKFTVKNAEGGVKFTIKVQGFNGKAKSKAVSKSATTKPFQLEHADWNPEVKDALNAMMAKEAQKGQYAVFDFDNTCSIFDVEEQLAIHQLRVMAFAETMTPKKLAKVLATDLNPDYFKDPAPASYLYCDNEDATYQDWIDDIVAAYTKLCDSEYATDGHFTPAGLNEEQSAAIQQDPDWIEFAVKMRTMYDCVFDSESADVAYPWVLYWFTGMTEQEVYDLAYASHSFYKNEESYYEPTFHTTNADTKTGIVDQDDEYTHGTAVSANINELMKCLDGNGIDVWICSASATDPIRAAVDVWELHDYVTGLLAMTNVVEGKKYINEYDYDMGYAWFPKANGEWERDNVATKAQTQGKGKVTAVQNVCYPKYKGHGPIAGFMDSTGDFNFCTEFETLQVVCCFNRASRKTTDGGGVIAELAVYQADDLGLDYAKARKQGDTLYVLQGREENGLRGLRPYRTTMRLGKTEAQLYRDKDSAYEEDGTEIKNQPTNTTQYNYMVANEMSTAAVINRFSKKKAPYAAGNPFNFKIGFLAKYDGYHSQK